jgi:maltose alpha-D-glucosyltransferase/alpha-amylase
VDVPEVSNKAMLVMVHRLDTSQIQVTVLNFSSQPIAARAKSQHLAPGAAVIDMFTNQAIAEIDHEHSFAVWLEPHQGMSLLTVPAAASGPPLGRQPIDDRASGTE